MSDKKKDEAPVDPKDKIMRSQMGSDSWRDAQKALANPAAAKPQVPMHQLKRQHSDFEPVPNMGGPASGLELDKKPNLAGRTAFQPQAQPDKFGAKGPKAPPLRKGPEQEFDFGAAPSGLDTVDKKKLPPQKPGVNPMESSAGGVAGFQVPMGIRQRKEKVDEVLKQHPDIGEGAALAYLGQLGDEEADQVGNMLDTGDHSGVADRMRMHAVRQLVRNKVREVVRKKPGGGGYVLYAPNRGKKGKAKASGSFPTRAGAKRAELARFPPKDPQKLQRLRKQIKRLAKKPGGDDRPKPKRESTLYEAGPNIPLPMSSTNTPLARDPKDFVVKLGGIKDPKERGLFVTKHLSDPGFMGKLQAHPQGKNVIGMLNKFVNSPTNAGFKPGQTKTRAEAVREHMERRILSVIVKKSLMEALFREENTESEWDEYISRLSKQALAGDGKFQKLQKNISNKTKGMLDDSFAAIKKALGKNVALKSYGVKQDASSGQSYLAFGAEFEDGMSVEPMAIAIEGGLPKIHLSPNAKAALTKVDPDTAKMFRAELVTVQEAVLDEMDDLAKATAARDNYLQKLETNVDAYVASLSPLEVSVLKNLLTKKYRKIA